MSNIDKQALREEFLNMQDLYSDPADRERQEIYIAAEELLDELKADKEQIKALESRNRRLDGIIDAAERRIAELDKRLIEYAGIATREAHRVAELEARTVTPPKNNVANVGDSRWMWYQRDLMWIEAIRAAGIKVIEGEGQ
ncbi:ead/Ea22-like family protein [Salmonella enterica]|uniref:ead/Ea22-like family protein n=1 Tax=Salmonella enterica TaxID=28901 RepID=UPI0024909132|nr:ead/Ea22-like family protein [Salmonella enterica]